MGRGRFVGLVGVAYRIYSRFRIEVLGDFVLVYFGFLVI